MRLWITGNNVMQIIFLLRPTGINFVSLICFFPLNFHFFFFFTVLLKKEFIYILDCLSVSKWKANCHSRWAPLELCQILCKSGLFKSQIFLPALLPFGRSCLLLCALLPIFLLFSDLSKILTSADQHSAQTTIFGAKEDSLPPTASSLHSGDRKTQLGPLSSICLVYDGQSKVVFVFVLNSLFLL